MSLRDMPVVILAGGRGARFDHETQVLPKPMISVAGKPIIEHIVDSFVDQGFREFLVAGGHLMGELQRWAFGMNQNVRQTGVEVFVHDTGDDSHTGQRVWNMRDEINGRRFVLTYGDGLCSVSMADVVATHEKRAHAIWWGSERPPDPSTPILTLTAVRPPSRFGAIEFESTDDWGVGAVRSFREKPDVGWINGGFMVVEPQFIDRYLEGPDAFPLEQVAIGEAAAEEHVRAFKHTGYWRCMDTRRDLEQIEEDVRRMGRQRLPWRPSTWTKGDTIKP